MWRAKIALFAVLFMAAPSVARAQAYNYPEDQQDPQEYNDEDSQPLRVVSYVLAPIGVFFEWTIARPIHYLASNTFLAPVLGGERPEPAPQIPIAELPPSAASAAPAAAPTTVSPLPPITAADQPSGPPPSAPAGSQPVLH